MTDQTGQDLVFEVATPKGLVVSVSSSSVQAQSIEGEFGVLPGHIPLLAATRSGVLKYVVDGKTHIAACGPGFVEAGPHKVLMLCDAYVQADLINVEDVQQQRQVVEQKIKSFSGDYDSSEHAELVRALEWVQARLDAKAAAH